MNKQNKNILNIIKTKRIALFIIITLQLTILLFSIILLNKNFEEFINIGTIILFILIILCAIIDIIFYKMHISRVKYFLNKVPIECEIVDFLLISDGYDDTNQKEYRLYPIVKVNNELFFTYGNHCICGYNQKYGKINNIYTHIVIFRKDKSEVKIGDKAYLYIKEKIDINVEINVDKNLFKLNKQIEHFNNFNKNHDINIIKNLNFFEGIIDIEPME